MGRFTQVKCAQNAQQLSFATISQTAVARVGIRRFMNHNHQSALDCAVSLTLLYRPF